jgi:hypothetical protein
VADDAVQLKDPPSVPAAISQTYTMATLKVEVVLRGPSGKTEDISLVVSNTVPDWETPPPAGTRALFLLNPRTRESVPGIDVPDVFFNLVSGRASLLNLDGDRISGHAPELVRVGPQDSKGALVGLRIDAILAILRSIPSGSPTAQEMMSIPTRGFEAAQITVAP